MIITFATFFNIIGHVMATRIQKGKSSFNDHFGKLLFHAFHRKLSV
jgi:hypothetical protein